MTSLKPFAFLRWVLKGGKLLGIPKAMLIGNV